jgi:hypothetical protein
MDNASSNDTLLAAIQKYHEAEGLSFDATHSRLRCMPHTIHLAALEVILIAGSKWSTDRFAAS